MPLHAIFSIAFSFSLPLRACAHAVDNFTDAAVSARLNGEHKEKDLEPWDGGEQHGSDSLESLDTDVVSGFPAVLRI